MVMNIKVMVSWDVMPLYVSSNILENLFSGLLHHITYQITVILIMYTLLLYSPRTQINLQMQHL
jgi:hypothetical protein